jgi:hypothetical protein
MICKIYSVQVLQGLFTKIALIPDELHGLFYKLIIFYYYRTKTGGENSASTAQILINPFGNNGIKMLHGKGDRLLIGLKNKMVLI